MRIVYAKLFLVGLFFANLLHSMQPDLTELYDLAKHMIYSAQTTGLESLLEAYESLAQATDELGNTLLHHAVKQKNRHAAELLLSKNSNPNAQNKDEYTPLILAIVSDNSISDDFDLKTIVNETKEQIDLVNLLLASNASPSKRASNMDPLVTAAFFGYYHIVESLLTCSDQAIPQEQKDEALCIAIKTAALKADAKNGQIDQHKETIKLLSKHGANVQGRSEWEFPYLCLAVGLPDIVRILLEHKADVDSLDPDFKTPLIKALERGCFRSASILLRHGANPIPLDSNRENAISLAIKYDREKELQEIINAIRFLFGLLAKNVREDINEELKQEDLEKLSYLLAEDLVEEFLKTVDESSPAIQQSLKCVHKLIDERHNKTTKIETLHAMYLELLSNALCTAVKSGKVAMAEIIIKNIKIVSDGDFYSAYYFPLRKAIKGNHLELAALLIKHGAKIQKEELTFMYPEGKVKRLDLLKCARKRGHSNIVRLLLLNGLTPSSPLNETLSSFKNEESLPLLEYAVEAGNMTRVSDILSVMTTPDFEKNDVSERILLASIKRARKLLNKSDLYRKIVEALTKSYLKIYQEERLNSLEQLFSTE